MACGTPILLTAAVLPPTLHYTDELLQSRAEPHSSHAWQQQKRAGPLQAPQDQRVVVAPSSLPSGRLVCLRLLHHSRLRHLHPSSPSAVEACGIRRILDTAEALLPSCLSVKCVAGARLITGPDKDLVVWAVCMGQLTPGLCCFH